MGIKKEKPQPIKSLNQEIYKQIKLIDEATREFNEKQYEKIMSELKEKEE